MELTYKNRLPDENLTFSVTICTEHTSADTERVRIGLTGSRQDGTIVVDGAFVCLDSELAMAGKALQLAVDSAQRLINGSKMPTQTPRQGRKSAPNAGQPWTPELKQQLQAAWLAESDATPAEEVTNRLARAMGRTRYAVRSQLTRVGCDPDVPGRRLAATTAGD